MALLAASVAIPAGTLRITLPVIVGVSVAVYDGSFDASHVVIEAFAVPEIETSACSNPETVSLNVMVTSNAPV